MDRAQPFSRKMRRMRPEIQKLEAAHVHFVACGNAMKKQHLEAADLVAGVDVVPAGIVEVVRKQEAGWVYIKAGR